MRARELAIVAVVAVVAAAGCIHNAAPEARDAEAAATDGHGSTIIVHVKAQQLPVAGELIAIDGRDVYVLVGGRLAVVPRERIETADLYEYQTGSESIGTWGTLGTISTVSHGFFAMLSFPIWLAVAVTTTSVESRAPHLEYPDDSFDDFVRWSRFPQGLPPGVTGRLLMWDDRPRGGPPGTTATVPTATVPVPIETVPAATVPIETVPAPTSAPAPSAPP